MRILITAAGSRGDVVPYTGLGAELRRAGHDVALATTDAFAPLVRDAGLEFRALPADPRMRGEGTGRRELMRTAAAFVTELGHGFADAVSEGADLLLLSTTTAPLGWQLAEATGISSLDVYLQPTAPTGDFPSTVMSPGSLGRPLNRATGRFALRMADRVYEQAVAEMRHRLQLPPASAAALRRRQEQANRPVLHGFSTALVPRPADWRSGLQVVGNWWPHHDPAAQLPANLEDFLRAGPRPVLIGFGSMAAGDGERLSEIAVRALRRAGLRGILQSGSAGLAADGDDVITVGDVPHTLLFPRLAAVVHHAGAGTSAAALRAGVPAVPVPVTADQPFWAARLAALGAAPTPISYRSLTAERLADALDQVVKQQTYARAAARAAQHMATEDGTGQTLKAVERLT
ncbi:glycosyltransferase [Streptomyces diastatochromogenes]|uniref:UDP-glucose--sterol glucosyltransferase n=1 Tax=Streptomyces diastatochromogenes TaxID=42236 RepID=A0A233SB57_STRDA|nr:glycosyltransferase [Streptomyces diastatochromogenes]OXY92862.1 UDP-glucose--sterol glucosyltransferase [Streptomyces diastatochromogenes]